MGVTLDERIRRIRHRLVFWGSIATALAAIGAIGVKTYRLSEPISMSFASQIQHLAKWNFDRVFKTSDYYMDAGSEIAFSDPAQAILLFNTALEKNPHNDEALARRATAYMLEGDYAHAKSDAEQALTVNPSYSEAYILKAMIIAKVAQDSGKPHDGVTALTDAIDKATEIHNPQMDSVLHLARGSLFASEKDFDLAIYDFKEATKLNNQNYFAYLALAGAYTLRDAKNNQEHRSEASALEAVNKAIFLNPKISLGYGTRALVRDMNDQPEEALADLATTEKLSPEYIEPHAFIAMISIDRDNPHKNDYRAIDEFTAAIKSTKSVDQRLYSAMPPWAASPEILRTFSYMERGKLYLKVGMFGPAIDDFNVSLDRDPANKSIWACKAYAEEHAAPPVSSAEYDLSMARWLLRRADQQNSEVDLTGYFADCMNP
jgi:tetratricopeptide (TPR) repeat protein